jgi:hypothetical protein
VEYRPLFAAVAVLAVLGGYVWWSDHQPETITLEDHEIELLPDLEAESVRRLTLRSPKSTLVLVRQGEEDWVIEGDTPRLAVPEMAEAAARAAISIISTRRLGDIGTGEGIGLADGLQVSVELEGRNQPFTFTLGSSPPLGAGRYLKEAGQTEVHLVERGPLRPLEQDPLAFRDRRLMPVDPDDVMEVTITPRPPAEVFSMRRDGRHWFLDHDPPFRVDTAKARGLVHDLVELEAEAFDVPPPAADEVDIRVQIADSDGQTATLRFGAAQPGGARNAVASGPLLNDLASDQPARVRADFLADFDPDPTAWRSLELLDFNPWLVTEIDWSVAGQSWALRKGDEGWKRTDEGAAVGLDGDLVHDLLAELDGLRAVDYAPADLEPASAGVEAARIELRQGEDLRIAMTLFRGGNEDYVAIEGEPGLRLVGADVHEAMGTLRPLEVSEP